MKIKIKAEDSLFSLNDVNQRLKEIPDFIRFLKEHNAYWAFVRDAKNFFMKVYPNQHLDQKRCKKSGLIMSSFNWSKTPEGGKFWCDLHEKWINMN